MEELSESELETHSNSHDSVNHQHTQNDTASSENPRSEGFVKPQPSPEPPPPAPTSAIGDELAHDQNQMRQCGEDDGDDDLGYQNAHQVFYRESLNEAVMNLALKERGRNGGDGGNEESSDFGGEGEKKNEIGEAWEGSDGDGGRVDDVGEMEEQYGNDGDETEDEEEEGNHGAEEVNGGFGGNRNYRKTQNQFPLRIDAEDCAFYMKTGNCRFGMNCKFNHPKRRHQGMRDRMKPRAEDSDRLTQTECKYYLTSGGCKFGNACKFNHSRDRSAASPIMEFNFLGLPIRLGEKECAYYMRTGSCKYGSNCKFNHPDPMSAAGNDHPSGNGSMGSGNLHGATQLTTSSWSSSSMMFPQNQGIPDHNGYQIETMSYSTSETGLPTPPALAMNIPATENKYFDSHPQQMPVDEFPQRPGQPECSFFLKTGDCKYKASCRYHHPKLQSPMSTPCTLSDKGLPLRPDQSICSFYNRYGICKFGPACKFDHPENWGKSLSF